MCIVLHNQAHLCREAFCWPMAHYKMIELSKQGHKDSHLTKEKWRWLYNQMGAHYDVYSNQKEHTQVLYVQRGHNVFRQ